MANMVAGFWKDKKVFLTGHTGFKGSWLALWLHQMGAKVTGYSLPPPTKPSLFESAEIDKLVESHYGDIRDIEKLSKVFFSAQPEIVIHMAAQALVRLSYEQPVDTYSTNVMGTVNVLELCRKTSSVRVVVNVTSDKCYENKEREQGYREDEPMGGFDPYSSSKGCSELVTAAYRRSFLNKNIAVATARAGNVIGGGDWAQDRLIPDIMKAIGRGEAVKIRNPHAIRPWQHVLEPLSGYLRLAQQLYDQGQKYAQAYNFGPAENDAKEVEWIVKKMTSVWGPNAKYVIENDKAAPHEAHYLRLDCSKAKNELDWSPRWSLEQALVSIVDWNRRFLDEPTMARQITLEQINQFQHASGVVK